MSKFTFQIVNHRGDESQLNLLLTSTSGAGLEGIELGKSTSVADFFSSNPSHSFSAEKLVGSRLYVGYGGMPPAPDPNSNQYYGWIEFSRNPDADKGVWLNLSNVDIVGLPLTLKGTLADGGHPFSLGYSKPVKDIIANMKTRALTRQDPAVVKDCGGGRTKIVAPNIQFPFYRRYDDYLNTLTMAGAKLTIQTDTPIGEKSKTFTGNFSKGRYQDLADTGPILTIASGSDTFQILKSQFTTEYLYRCDGGTVVLNGATLPQNRPDNAGHDASAVTTNSLFRNLCIGINEGYFTADGANDSTKFSADKPFGNDQGNVYAQIIHEASNSYGFPYADANLKTLLVAAIDSPIVLTILKDDEAADYQS
ncbi:MAG TPA: beta-1,3-glucanase family protein [Bradyrhizobium sp.]|nr:beta-1,3-glucanase family protein [Bradyrhizobium sp.]